MIFFNKKYGGFGHNSGNVWILRCTAERRIGLLIQYLLQLILNKDEAYFTIHCLLVPEAG